jgi:hypothetical protein
VIHEIEYVHVLMNGIDLPIMFFVMYCHVWGGTRDENDEF